MARRRGREDWRRAVLREGKVSDGTRVMLLAMFEYVKPDMTVSVPRSTLATMLGKSERRITERVRDAQDGGFLGRDPIVRGQKGRTAVYACMFPDFQGAVERPAEQESKGAKKRPAENRFRGTDGGPTSSKRLPERSLLGWLPNGGIEEECQPRGSSTEVHRRAVPGWDREESA